jgi:uncharacterized membrane protein
VKARTLAALLTVTGSPHFLTPKPFDGIVPKVLPGSPRFWTYASGAAEFATALALANRGTRRLGGVAAAALFIGVLPAKVQMALDWRDKPAAARALAWGRLPLQAPLVWSAIMVARGAE